MVDPIQSGGDNFEDINQRPMIGGTDFDELRRKRIKLYSPLVLDLTSARDKEEFAVSGNYLYAAEGTDGNANVDIIFNELIYDSVNVKKGRGVRAPFYRLFISNAAQTSKSITLFVGVGEERSFEILDLGQVVNLTSAPITIQESFADYYTVFNDQKAYMAGFYQGAVATRYTAIGLFNQIDTGDNLVLDRVDIRPYGSTTADLFVFFGASQLSPITGELTQTWLAASNKYMDANAYPGGVNAGRIRYGSATTPQLFIGANTTEVRNIMQGREHWHLEFADHKPVITNDYGFLVVLTTVNEGLHVSFQWHEVTP